MRRRARLVRLFVTPAALIVASLPVDVQRVARKYLHPDQLVILVVGDTKAVRAGGHDKAPELRFDAFGPVTELPLRDPDTLRR